MARNRYGSPPEVHRDRARSTLREIRRLERVIRTKFKSPPDCVHLAHLVADLSQQQGALMIDRADSGPARGVYGSTRRILDRFVKSCVVHPRSKAAERKIHAIWR